MTCFGNASQSLDTSWIETVEQVASTRKNSDHAGRCAP
jgi:hypothetical protein